MADDADYSGDNNEINPSEVKVLHVRHNLGDLPYLMANAEGDMGLREVCYHKDHFVERYPLIWCGGRAEDCLEMNLFMEHRYRGFWRPPKRGGHSNSLGGVSIQTLYSIANSLRIFLSWIVQNQLDLREVTVVSASDRAKYWLQATARKNGWASISHRNRWLG